ncbi:DUF86 domain-containing protein [Pseudorhodoferax sp. Leaf274]|uniref:HepT-like ribonuclease domain-containing protein n=1 Tax=Pseudorhodoferax sp. Leaf274 TaxID=1736318 RepID=UPI0007036EB8|nr:HepT-like ribonuclease domain-containing protein [Pseudorhodoferax sp. Leaf274]KQP37402.1 hypothetical protein ASF44_13660 [Pseudorhodoferax sp. Leaf274]
MTDRLPKLLVDALGAIAAAQEFVAGIPLEGYLADKMRRSAVERQLEILGEACSRMLKLEPATAGAIADLKLAVSLRNRVIHGYDAVDDEVLYFTVVDDLDALKSDLTRLLNARVTASRSTPPST